MHSEIVQLDRIQNGRQSAIIYLDRSDKYRVNRAK